MSVDEVLLWENPDMLNNPWYGQPRRHAAAARKGHQKNPAGALAMPRALRDWTHGVGVEDILGGGAGLLGAGTIPRWVVAPAKATSGEALTTNEKWMRVLVGAVATLGIGFLAQQVAGSRAAKAAVIGGLAGTTITAVNSLTTMRLGNPVGQGSSGSVLTPVDRRAASSKVGTQTPGFEDIKLY